MIIFYIFSCGCGRSKVSHGNETTDGQTNREHELTEPGQASRTELNGAYMRLPVSLLRRGFRSKNISALRGGGAGDLSFPFPSSLTRFLFPSPQSPRHKNQDYTKERGRGTQRQYSENICSEDDLRSRIFGIFVAKFFACLPLLGFSNI